MKLLIKLDEKSKEFNYFFNKYVFLIRYNFMGINLYYQ